MLSLDPRPAPLFFPGLGAGRLGLAPPSPPGRPDRGKTALRLAVPLEGA